MNMRLHIDTDVRNPPGFFSFLVKPLTGAVVSGIYDAYLSQQFALHFSFLESQLRSAPGTTVDSNGRRIGGICEKRFTAADMFLSFGLISAVRANLIPDDKYPELVAYAKRLQDDPVYQRGLAKVAEVQKQGKITASL